MTPTRTTYTVAAFEALFGALPAPIRETAESVEVVRAGGAIVQIVVNIRAGVVKQVGWDAV